MLQNELGSSVSRKRNITIPSGAVNFELDVSDLTYTIPLMAKAKQDKGGRVLLYQTEDGQIRLEVNLDKETVWLTLNQMAALFDRDKSVISRHLRNIFKTRELSKGATVAKFATVQAEGQRQVERQVEYFNLDAIISVGYRVNSIRGTRFRIWATNILKNHLVQGYTLNEKRLQTQQTKINELQRAIQLIGRVFDNKALSSDEAAGLIRVIRDYSYGLDLLDAYDYQRLDITATSKKKTVPVSYAEAKKAIEQLRRQYKASDLFGREKDQSFQGSLVSIFQTFGKKPLLSFYGSLIKTVNYITVMAVNVWPTMRWWR